MEITLNHAQKVIATVDAGLSLGLGVRKPGYMCVEAAVCYALGLPHGDDPACVAPILRSLKIRLNDSQWSSNEARAKGLRRLAVIQLGSKDHLDEVEFRKRLVDYALRISTPQALRSAASVNKNAVHKQALLTAANRCESEGTREAVIAARKIAYDAAYAAYAAADDADDADADAAAAAAAAADAAAAAAAADAADAAAAAAAAVAADAAARDKSLSDYAEAVVQMLVAMNVPGLLWLPLTDTDPAMLAANTAVLSAAQNAKQFKPKP